MSDPYDRMSVLGRERVLHKISPQLKVVPNLSV